MNKLLYYPYINIPRTDWSFRTLLYYDNIASIVPQEYFYAPERNYDNFMLELIQNELVTPINPMDILDNPWEATEPFLKLIEENQEKLIIARNNFRQENYNNNRYTRTNIKIHADKFDSNIFYHLEQLGLAIKSNGYWYSVEIKTANSLMSFLASVIGTKTNRLPTTDYIRPFYTKYPFYQQQRKRETILTNLIPFPENIDLNQLHRFKEQHHELLKAFRTKVEKIVLDSDIIEDSPLFHEHLTELLQRKQELSAKMNESNLGGIIFGTVCGLIGAYQGLAAASTVGAVVGGLPGFANAIYSALQIERVENIFDQSGLKYLALADKRLRKNGKKF